MSNAIRSRATMVKFIFGSDMGLGRPEERACGNLHARCTSYCIKRITLTFVLVLEPGRGSVLATKTGRGLAFAVCCILALSIPWPLAVSLISRCFFGLRLRVLLACPTAFLVCPRPGVWPCASSPSLVRASDWPVMLRFSFSPCCLPSHLSPSLHPVVAALICVFVFSLMFLSSLSSLRPSSPFFPLAPLSPVAPLSPLSLLFPLSLAAPSLPAPLSALSTLFPLSPLCQASFTSRPPRPCLLAPWLHHFEPFAEGGRDVFGAALRCRGRGKSADGTNSYITKIMLKAAKK